jgi:hypothetical protein
MPDLAREMFDECLREELSARVASDDEQAAAVRAQLRRLGREQQVRIRTARMVDTVLLVRLDAQIWNDDAATMRRKLTPNQ